MGVPSLRYYLADFPTLGIQLPAALDADKQQVYFPVASTCTAIEVDVRTQRPRLQRDFAEHLVRLRLPTSGGPQELLCIDYDALGLWLATIQAERTGNRVRERIRRFRALVMAAASDILTGKLTPVPLEERRRAARNGDDHTLQLESRLSQLERAVFVGEPDEEDTRVGHCPHCGGPIKVTVGSLRIAPGE